MHSIRRAHPSDARALSELAVSTFRATFGARNSVDDMNLHCRGAYGEALQAAEIADPHMTTLVCEFEGALVAYAQLRWRNAPACVVAKNPGEIQRLYVAEAWHGRGVAQALMGECVEVMKSRACDAVWLGVWEHNPRAIAFYGKHGFVEVGEHVFPLGTDPQRDVIMLRQMSATMGP